MGDLLLAALVFPLLVALAVALLAALTLVPFLVALQMADARRFSTARWGAVTIVASLLGLALALLVARSDSLPALAVLIPLAVTWAGPAALRLLTGEEELVGGRAGRHEQP